MADWVVGQVAHMDLHHQIDSHSQVRTLHEFLAARPMKAFQLSSYACRVTSKYSRCHQSRRASLLQKNNNKNRERKTAQFGGAAARFWFLYLSHFLNHNPNNPNVDVNLLCPIWSTSNICTFSQINIC